MQVEKLNAIVEILAPRVGWKFGTLNIDIFVAECWSYSEYVPE